MGQFARTEYQTPSVADESALSDIWVAREEDGSLVWVQSTQSHYALNRSSGAVAMAGSVVPTTTLALGIGAAGLVLYLVMRTAEA